MLYIYLHGFASGPASGKAQFFREKLAAEGRELLIPDLECGGFENLTLSGQLRIVEETAKGQPVVLFGSSMGGYLAAIYATRHKETSRVVLMAPAFDFAGLWERENGPGEMARWEREGAKEFYHYKHERAMRVSFELISDARRYEAYPDVTQPVLLFHGIGDTVVPPGLSRRFSACRPNVRLRLVDSDHQLTDAVELVWKEARGFCLAAESGNE